jgi:hypothetical protein
MPWTVLVFVVGLLVGAVALHRLRKSRRSRPPSAKIGRSLLVERLQQSSYFARAIIGAQFT